MKITIEPSHDQSGAKYPHYAVSIEHPSDDPGYEGVLELIQKLLRAYGYMDEAAPYEPPSVEDEDVAEDEMLDPGVGYRLLQEGETISEGDEMWSSGRGPWEPIGLIRDAFDNDMHVPMRRKIDAELPLPSHLPKLPPLPNGYSRWVYRGMGWEGKGVTYAACHETPPHKWGPTWNKATTGRASNHHYIQALP